MKELTESPKREPLHQEPAQAPEIQKIDNEGDKSTHYQRSKDPLSGLCYIEEDMKGAKGKLDGLFGM